MKIKEDPIKNSFELDLLDDSGNVKEKEEDEHCDKLFGNDINIEKPSKLGKLRVLLYIKNYPLIVIGAHCNLILI